VYFRDDSKPEKQAKAGGGLPRCSGQKRGESAPRF
jgi:hypothetical protein